MMLAYQPVKSLTKVNVSIGQGLSAARRILPIIDTKNEINLNKESKNLKLTSGISNSTKLILHISQI